MILLIDNYDSFVHNLACYFRQLGASTKVVRNDAIHLSEIADLAPEAIVLSPGPCTPEQAGCSVAVVQRYFKQIPILGVCLGHQAIAVAFGGRIVRASEPMHGRISRVFHDQQGIFAGLPSPLTGCRYHSLIVDESSLPDELEVTARTNDGTIMAIEHGIYPLVGLQFHPEAILTEHGGELIAAFLRRARGSDPSSPRAAV